MVKPTQVADDIPSGSINWSWPAASLVNDGEAKFCRLTQHQIHSHHHCHCCCSLRCLRARLRVTHCTSAFWLPSGKTSLRAMLVKAPAQHDKHTEKSSGSQKGSLMPMTNVATLHTMPRHWRVLILHYQDFLKFLSSVLIPGCSELCQKVELIKSASLWQTAACMRDCMLTWLEECAWGKSSTCFFAPSCSSKLPVAYASMSSIAEDNFSRGEVPAGCCVILEHAFCLKRIKSMLCDTLKIINETADWAWECPSAKGFHGLETASYPPCRVFRYSDIWPLLLKLGNHLAVQMVWRSLPKPNLFALLAKPSQLLLPSLDLKGGALGAPLDSLPLSQSSDAQRTRSVTHWYVKDPNK